MAHQREKVAPGPTQRRLVAALATDVVGYTRLMEVDEQADAPGWLWLSFPARENAEEWVLEVREHPHRVAIISSAKKNDRDRDVVETTYRYEGA